MADADQRQIDRKMNASLTSTTVSDTYDSMLVINPPWMRLVTDIGCRKN